MTAAPAPAWSVNQRAAHAVCRHALDVDDARYLLEVLGLVAEDGGELLPDDTQLITKELLAVELGAARPPLIVREPAPRRSTVPEGLRDLSPAPEPKKAKPMSAPQSPPRSRVQDLEDRLVAAGVVRRDDPAPRPRIEPAPYATAVDGPYVAALSVVELFVDHSYQRPLDEPRVKRMVAGWSPRMLGILDVSDRGQSANPRYAIVNGQHRWAAAGRCGVQYLACNVHEDLDVAAEARLMYELDRSTKKLSGFDQWRARRGAGDPTVVDVEAVCRIHGLRVDPAPSDGSMRAYGSAEKLLKLGGRNLLDNALGVLRAAYGPSHTAYQAPLLMGVGQFLHRHGAAVDVDRLIRALTVTRPEQLRSTATALREVDGGPLHQLMTAAIAGAYNRTSGAGPRLSGGSS